MAGFIRRTNDLILDAIDEGFNTPGAIADTLSLHAWMVRQHLDTLVVKNVVTEHDDGTYSRQA